MKNTPHPAKFTKALEPYLQANGLVLDPFAGTGRIGKMVAGTAVGVELEREWAIQGREYNTRMVIGNSILLPFKDNTFDAIVTSPAYGNRMADRHDAKDGSLRRSYRHLLGRNLTFGNTGGMHWCDKYRRTHMLAYAECVRVLKRGGMFVLNISDHIRKGRRVPVSDWHTQTLIDLGLTYLSNLDIETPRMRFVANRKRAEREHVRRFSKPI